MKNNEEDFLTASPEHEENHQVDDQNGEPKSSRGDFDYKDVSEASDVTEESIPDGLEMLKEGVRDLENYERLM